MEIIILTPETLQAMEDRFSSLFDKKIQQLLTGIQQPKLPNDDLLSRKEAAEHLGISLVTLNDWTKDGKVTGYRISSRIRYKKSELSNALRQIKSVNR